MNPAVMHRYIHLHHAICGQTEPSWDAGFAYAFNCATHRIEKFVENENFMLGTDLILTSGISIIGPVTYQLVCSTITIRSSFGYLVYKANSGAFWRYHKGNLL